jgi:Sulfotransferase family
MPFSNIHQVSWVGDHKDALLAFSIDSPQPNSTVEISSIAIGGWILGSKSRVVAVNVENQCQTLRNLPLSGPRPDVAALYPGAVGIEKCSFWGAVSVLGLPPSFELDLYATFEDGSRVNLGTIRASHKALQTTFEPTLQPLMITSLGRTGTTWLMRLLSQHPGIVAFEKYPYEIRPSGYWLHMTLVLSEPANHLQSSHPDTYHANPWAIGANPFYQAPVTQHSQMRQWFGRTYVERLASFCQQNIEEFYTQVAMLQHKTGPVFYAEKFHPERIPWLAWELYPKAREILLVRDFRDMACSILAFNRKRGIVSFGREKTQTDEEYVRQLREQAMRLLRSWRARAHQAHLIRYEDLILEPYETLTAALDYMGLDSSQAEIAAMVDGASEETDELRRHRTSSGPEASIGRWRREFDPPIQTACRESFDDILEEFGYAPEPGRALPAKLMEV